MEVSVVYLVLNPPLDRLAAQVEFMRAVADDFVFVVDDRTEQATIDIIKDWPGTTVVPFTWIDDFAAGRNVGLPLVKNPWTLHLDPDELPTVAMMEHIKKVTDPEFRSSNIAWLYWTPNWWGGWKGEEMPYHWHIRLWRSGQGKFYRAVHELVMLDGLEEPMTRGRLAHEAPKSAYLIHSKPWAAVEADQDLYGRLGERSM
jgi:hypothetical protein